MNDAMSSSSASAIAEADAHMLTLPLQTTAEAATSLAIRSIVKSTLRACSSRLMPAGVGWTPRRERVSNGTPSSLSSCAIRLLIADGSMCASSAARAMLR